MHARTHKCLCISVCSSFICATTWLFTDIIRKGGKEEKAKQVKSHFSCTSCVVLYVTSLHFFHLLLDIASKRVFTDNSALIHYPDLLCNPAYKVLIVTDDDHRTYYSTLRSKCMGQKKKRKQIGRSSSLEWRGQDYTRALQSSALPYTYSNNNKKKGT